MKVEKKVEGKNVTLVLDGRLDTNTSPILENELVSLDDLDMLVFDFTNLNYISSAGLRILLSCQKKMSTHGKMIVKHANADIKEIFDITGFSDIITLE